MLHTENRDFCWTFPKLVTDVYHALKVLRQEAAMYDIAIGKAKSKRRKDRNYDYPPSIAPCRFPFRRLCIFEWEIYRRCLRQCARQLSLAIIAELNRRSMDE